MELISPIEAQNFAEIKNASSLDQVPQNPWVLNFYKTVCSLCCAETFAHLKAGKAAQE